MEQFCPWIYHDMLVSAEIKFACFGSVLSHDCAGIYIGL